MGCGLMRLQRGCLRNYPSERQTVDRGESSLPFLEESGSLHVSLVAVTRQPPRFPSRETPFSFRNDPSEAKEWGVGWLASSSAQRQEAARSFPFCCQSCANSGTSAGPFVSCGTIFVNTGFQSERVPDWLLVTRLLETLGR